MKRLSRFFVLVALVIVAAAALSACAGRSVDATNVTHNSATLNAEINTDGAGDGAQVFFRYRPVGAATWTNTEVNGHDSYSNNIISEPVSGLNASTEYEYEVCGRPNSSVEVGCNLWDTDGDGNLDNVPPTRFTTSVAPSSTFKVVHEDQGWQSVQSHLHDSWSALTMFQRVTEPITVPVTVTTHNNSAPVDYVRWSCESDVKQRVELNWGAGGTASTTVNLRIDPSLCPDGWREIRITANRSTGEREFTTSRLAVYFDSGNGSDSNYSGSGTQVVTTADGVQRVVPTSAGRCGGGAWYPAEEYQIIFVNCLDYWKGITSGFRPGDTIRVRSQDGRGIVTLNPDFHNGSRGREIATNLSPNTWTSVRLPTDLSPGPLTVHMRSLSPVNEAEEEAGVHVLRTKIV